MSSRSGSRYSRGHAGSGSSRPNYRPRSSYNSFDSDGYSSDEYSSDSDEEYRRRKNGRQRSSSEKRQYASDKVGGLTKSTSKAPSSRSYRAASDGEGRRRHRSRNYYYDSSSGSDYSDSDSDSNNDSDGNRSSENSSKGDMSVDATSYNRKKKKTRLEKKVDEILDAFGLLHIKNDPSRRQLSSPDPEKYAKQKQAIQAALTAAAIEAWRSHSKPGGFNLQKVMRVVAAAIAAGGVDVLVEARPGHDNMRDIAEAVVGGLATSKSLGGKITHRREGGAQGKMIDGFIALAASKMVKPPKEDEILKRKKEYAKEAVMDVAKDTTKGLAKDAAKGAAKKSRTIEPMKHSSRGR